MSVSVASSEIFVNTAIAVSLSVGRAIRLRRRVVRNEFDGRGRGPLTDER